MNLPKHSAALSRRSMLQMSAAAATACILPGKLTNAAAIPVPPRCGIALQLYSVRNDCKKDFDKTLEEVAKLGFDAVEFAGYHNYADDAKGLRARLDDLGLKAAATHIGTNNIEPDKIQATIEFHKTIGCKYLCIPGDKRFSQPDGSKELAEIFNKAAAMLKQARMYCGYHNHTHEFKTEGDKTYWELFAERTSKAVVLQQDVGWTTHAGHDPVKYIRQYPGRSQVIHCKPTVVGDEGRPIIGEDGVKWLPILKACREVGNTEWLTVEQERYLPNTSPMECVKLSLAGLKKVQAELG